MDGLAEWFAFASKVGDRDAGGVKSEAAEIVFGMNLRRSPDNIAGGGSRGERSLKGEVGFVGMRIRPEEGGGDDRDDLEIGVLGTYKLSAKGAVNVAGQEYDFAAISSGKMVLQKQPPNASWWLRLTENPWRISEIAPYSIFRTQKGSPSSVEPVRQDDWVRLQAAVTYVGQEDETLCQSAALQMTLASIDSGFQSSQREIRAALESHKAGPLSHDARKEFAEKQCPQYNWTNRYERNVENVVRAIKAQLKLGVPVSMSTRLTPSGHVIVVTGIGRDASGKWLVEAHDPAGAFDFYRRKFNGGGSSVRYELAKLSVRTQRWSNGNQKELAFYVVGEECWHPPLRTLSQRGFQPDAESDMDWEWLAADQKSK